MLIMQWTARVSYLFLLTANFPRRRISRYAQMDLFFREFAGEMLNASLRLPAVVGEVFRS